MSSESSSDNSTNASVTSDIPDPDPVELFVAGLSNDIAKAIHKAVEQVIEKKSRRKRKRNSNSKNSEDSSEIYVYSDGEEVEVIPYKKPPPVTVELE